MTMPHGDPQDLADLADDRPLTYNDAATVYQTSLTADQARIDADGMLRFVISQHDPGVANWLELTGRTRGYVQVRWQGLTRDLTDADGPQVSVIRFADLAAELPHYEHARIDPAEYRARIAARQAAVANRMVG